MRSLNMLASLWLAAVVAAQPHQVVLVKRVDGANALSVGVLWSHGYADDAAGECGLVRVVLSCRLERARRAVPDCLASGMQVHADCGLAFAVVGGGDEKRAMAFLAALLDERQSEFTDDELALITARVALAADDAEFLYPGSVLLTSAHRQLGRGTAISLPPLGVASAIAQLSPDRVRAALRQPVPVRVACLGQFDAALEAALEALPLPGLQPAVRGDLACPEVDGLEAMTTLEHDRVDSPYVSAAFAVPAGDDRAAFALAMEIATARAFRRWRYRGFEQSARAPFVSWSWVHADPLVQFCRRGENPRQLLPGERPEATAKDEANATKAELQVFLDDLREVPPTGEELGFARAALRSRWRFAAAGESSPWATESAMYPGRLQVLLLAAHHGIDVARLDSVSAASVHEVLQRVLRPDLCSWHALMPANSTSYGYRRR